MTLVRAWSRQLYGASVAVGGLLPAPAAAPSAKTPLVPGLSLP